MPVLRMDRGVGDWVSIPGDFEERSAGEWGVSGYSAGAAGDSDGECGHCGHFDRDHQQQGWEGSRESGTESLRLYCHWRRGCAGPAAICDLDDCRYWDVFEHYFAERSEEHQRSADDSFWISAIDGDQFGGVSGWEADSQGGANNFRDGGDVDPGQPERQEQSSAICDELSDYR